MTQSVPGGGGATAMTQSVPGATAMTQSVPGGRPL